MKKQHLHFKLKIYIDWIFYSMFWVWQAENFDRLIGQKFLRLGREKPLSKKRYGGSLKLPSLLNALIYTDKEITSWELFAKVKVALRHEIQLIYLSYSVFKL